MRYYAVDFPNSVTLFVISPFNAQSMIRDMIAARGLRGHSGTIYNPKAFLSVSEIIGPNKQQKRAALNLNEALVG